MPCHKQHDILARKYSISICDIEISNRNLKILPRFLLRKFLAITIANRTVKFLVFCIYLFSLGSQNSMIQKREDKLLKTLNLMCRIRKFSLFPEMDKSDSFYNISMC